MLSWEDYKMPKTSAYGDIIALVLLSLVILLMAAHGCQVSAQTSTPTMNTPIQFSDHADRAQTRSMAYTENLLGSSADTVAHGEMPLSDIPTVERNEVPLGTIARQYREASTARQRATIRLEEQGCSK